MSVAIGCPGFDDQALGVSHALASVDCRVALAVTSSYGRLFGQNGAFGSVLTVLLTLYVAFIAVGLLTGRTRLSLSGTAPRVLSIGLVLTFATSWPAYHAVIYGLLVNGPEEIASAVGGDSGGAAAFAHSLDHLLEAFADAAKALGDAAPGTSKALGPLAGPQMAAALVWISGMLILLASAGALVLTRIVLALLLAIGPVFVVLALFRQTRGLFEAWLRTALLFALAPTLVVLAGSAALALLGPLIEAVAGDPAGAVSNLQPILELFMGSVVYVGLVVMLMWASASLVRGWSFGHGERDAEPGATTADPVIHSNGGATASTTGPNAAREDVRVGRVVGALARDAGRDAAPVSVRVEQAAAAPRAEPAAAGGAAPANAARRSEGLGQGFRPALPVARLSGPVR